MLRSACRFTVVLSWDVFSTQRTEFFSHHIAGGAADRTHAAGIVQICGSDLPGITSLDYVCGAISVAEREQWHLVGAATTRRTLRLLCQRYNDESIQAVLSSVCARIRTTVFGYHRVDLELKEQPSQSVVASMEIQDKSMGWFKSLEKACPGSLYNHCRYKLWHERHARERNGVPNPLVLKLPL